MLRFVICGLEHSGTTLVSELFRQVPGLDAGFEVGVLLARRPRDLPDYDPYYEQMIWGWGLTAEKLAWCCDTDSFKVFYARLAEAASLKPDTRGIFDKTPRYLAMLSECMVRVDVPFIIVTKDPRATVHSDFRGAGATDFDAWFETYAEEKLGYMRLAYDQWQQRERARDRRSFLLRLEDLCLDTRRSASAMFAHVGCRFQPSYTVFQDVRFRQIRGRSISVGAPFEYLSLGPERCRRIRDRFAEFAGWFYE